MFNYLCTIHFVFKCELLEVCNESAAKTCCFLLTIAHNYSQFLVHVCIFLVRISDHMFDFNLSQTQQEHYQ